MRPLFSWYILRIFDVSKLFNMNKIVFDESTDYADVYRIVKLMRGDIVARGKRCCQSAPVKAALCEANPMIDAAATAAENGDDDRFKQAVEAAYLTLYPFSLDVDYNYGPNQPV